MLMIFVQLSAVALETLLDMCHAFSIALTPEPLFIVDSSLTSQWLFNLPISNNAAALKDSELMYCTGQCMKSTQNICCTLLWGLLKKDPN